MKRPGITLFKKILGILGCLFFLFSMILPFYYQTYLAGNMIGDILYYSTYCWSFRVLQESSLFRGYSTPRSTDYWFYQSSFYNYIPGPSFSMVLIVIFEAQLLTLVTGIASVFYDRRILALAPLALCSLVIVLMTYTDIILTKANSVFYPYSPSLVTDSTFLLGYWFTYPAIILFLVSFILNIIETKKRSSTYTPTPTLTQ